MGNAGAQRPQELQEGDAVEEALDKRPGVKCPAERAVVKCRCGED